MTDQHFGLVCSILYGISLLFKKYFLIINMPAILSNFDIVNILERNNIFLVYIGYKDMLVDSKLQSGCYIINMSDSDDGTGGSHWTAIMIDKNYAVYFDPLGSPPPWVVIQYLLNDNVLYNQKKIQNEVTAICGWYVILFIYYMTNMKKQEPNLFPRFQKFLNLFSYDVEDNRKLLQEYLKPLR